MKGNYLTDYYLWKTSNELNYKNRYNKVKRQNKILIKILKDIEIKLENLRNKNYNQIELAEFINYLEGVYNDKI